MNKKRGRPRKYKKAIANGYYYCRTCKTQKKIDEFYKSCEYMCKDCRKKARRERYKEKKK